MTDSRVDDIVPAAAGAPVRSAGGILREARQAQGLHIAALSAAIKVSQKKLESLEGDRLEELPDATFTRALAQTVCRSLKIDPAPVLALLPAAPGHRLDHVGEGINAPFRDRPGRREPGEWGVLSSSAVWGPLLIVIGAAVLYFIPGRWLANLQSGSTGTPSTSGPATPAAKVASSVSMSGPALSSTDVVATPVLQPPAADATVAESPIASASAAVSLAPIASGTSSLVSAPTAAADGASSPSGPATPSGVLQLHARSSSWVEVQDASSKVLLARVVQTGESLSLDGATPLRLKIGNAGATDVTFRGRPLDLTPSTRDNVARLELK